MACRHRTAVAPDPGRSPQPRVPAPLAPAAFQLLERARRTAHSFRCPCTGRHLRMRPPSCHVVQHRGMRALAAPQTLCDRGAAAAAARQLPNPHR